ncbi:hypothetical protein MBLNU457_6199t1 [Dothideomycetes sp. NU457]
MSKQQQNEADVIFNRANLALARSQRLIQSWLGPAPTSSEAEKTEEELEKEDRELFKPEPETLGVGAKVPEDELDAFGLKRKSTTSGDKLLEQLLGKKAAHGHRASKARVQRDVPQQNNKAPTQDAVSEDEEEGRASMIKSKASRKRERKPVNEPQPEENTANEESARDFEPDIEPPATKMVKEDSDEAEQSSRSAKSKRKGMSYMDQLLEEKARKKKKKKKQG